MTLLFPIIYSAALTYLVWKAFKVMSNGWGITLAGYVMPTGIKETISNSFWMYFFNFDFLMFFLKFNPPYWFNLNITSNLIN